MSRVEIQPSEIRKGDTIRLESKKNNGTAHEFCAGCNGSTNGWVHGFFRFYLLDRPTPPVELPSVPTLGWLSVCDAEPMLGRWRSYEPNFRRDDGSEYKSVLQDERDIERDRVTAFTEAVAVPKSALDELRAQVGREYRLKFDMPISLVYDFLTAVDNASTR